MLRLAILGIRGRRSAFAGAAVALFVAAVLVTACGILLASGLRSTPAPERYASAPVVVAHKQTFHHRVSRYDSEDVLLLERVRVDSALAARLAASAGVRRVVRDVSIRTEVLAEGRAVPGPGGDPTFAHGWSSAALTPFALSSGRAPARPGEVVLDAGLAHRGGLRVGARVRLGSVEPAAPVTVVGIAAPRHPLERQAAVFVTDGEAERLSGHPGRADALAVFPAPGTSTSALAAAVRRAVPAGVVVYTGSERGAPEFIDDADALEGLTAVSGMFGGLALIIAMFVIAATLGLAIQLREREIALLRAIAATPRQVRRMLRWEAILLALFASAAGYLPGVALAHTLIDAFAARGLAPESMAVDGGAIPALVTVFATVSVALLAAWAGARRAARVAPTRALQESAVEPRMIGAVRLLAGLVALAGAAASLCVALGSHNQDTALAASDSVALVLVAATRCSARSWRGSPRRPGAPRRAALARGWLPRDRSHPQRPAARRVGDDPPRARRRDGRHAAVLGHDAGRGDSAPVARPAGRRPRRERHGRRARGGHTRDPRDAGRQRRDRHLADRHRAARRRRSRLRLRLAGGAGDRRRGRGSDA